MNAKTLLLIVLVIDLLLFFGQTAVHSINPEITQNFYDVDNSLLGSADNGSLTVKTVNENNFPSDADAADTADGNAFTNTFRSIKSWFFGLPGVSHVIGIINAVPAVLKQTGLPNEISFGIGALWYMLSLFAVVSYFWGRE